jgi:hypothetical protein
LNPKLLLGKTRRRKAVASVIGGVLMLGIMFTVVFGYFMTYSSMTKAYNERAVETSQEGLSVTGVTEADGNFSVYLNDTGAYAVTIQAMIISSSSGEIVKFITTGGAWSRPELPIYLNGGQGSPLIDTGLSDSVASSGVVVKVLTSRGNVFAGTFPPQAASLAQQAITSGAIGDIYLSFNSYTYYNVTSGSPCPSGNPYSGYCIGKGLPAFTIPDSVSDIAFAITMTDLNPSHASIVLDQFSLLYQVFPQGSHTQTVPWFIVSNKTTGGYDSILGTYDPVVLYYDVPTTVLFAASGCVASAEGPNLCSSLSSSSNCSPCAQNPQTGAVYVSTVFIMSHGWETNSTTPNWSILNYSNANYGQNLPYVSTLYS